MPSTGTGPAPDDVAALRARLREGRARPVRAPADHLDPGEPGPRTGRGWAVTSRTAVVAVIVLALVATALVVRALGARPGDVVTLPAGTGDLVTGASTTGVPTSGGPAGGTPTTGEASPTPVEQDPAPAPAAPGLPATLVVHVVGAVREPGVVRLPDGARVVDAIDAAGGLRRDADADRLNLARTVVDGEQVAVPAEGEELPVAAGPEGQPAGADLRQGAGTDLVDVNAADAALLETLPGVGPVLAARIVEHRLAHGPFSDLASLRAVSGIGPALSARLADLVAFG